MNLMYPLGVTTPAKREPGPFEVARSRLNLSQRELAERLGTSLFAVVRWERGDIAPSSDILSQLNRLLDPASDELSAEPRAVIKSPSFESTGVRSASKGPPLLEHVDTKFLAKPRPNLAESLSSNQLWGDSDLALSDIFLRRTKPAATRLEALEHEISAGKNTYTYDAHTYHTKVPPQGIASVVSNYLPDGGLVLDPFSGSGMTGVAARYVGCDVILNELSPAASFISYNFTKPVDVDEFNSAVSRIVLNQRALRGALYNTECRECGQQVESLFTVWSYKLECNHCNEEFVLWDHCRRYGNNVREHKLLKKFPCPCCEREVNKSYLKRGDTVPVFLGYKCCSKKIMEHPLNDADRQKIADSEMLLDGYANDIPDIPLPEGVNLNQPRRHGLDTVAKFYTTRNLVACAALWRDIRRIEDADLAAAVAFAFTSLYQRVTRLSDYRFWGGSGNTANFNVPHISNEANVFVTFERKAKSIADHFATTAKSYSGRAVVRTGSATDLGFVPDNSVDLIFTDPPFGANINYSEMNILWEAWLGTFTDPTPEAIVSRVQGKDIGAYQRLMTDSLKEAYRVLRPNHWMVLVFMNSSEDVWNSLRHAITDAGFSIEKINIFDKQHGTFKQFVSDNTAGADLMIHCKKSSQRRHAVELTSSESVEDFLAKERNQIPVLPFLHVKRDAEVDFRTLYSRYIATAMQAGHRVLDFSYFRKQAIEFLREK